MRAGNVLPPENAPTAAVKLLKARFSPKTFKVVNHIVENSLFDISPWCCFAVIFCQELWTSSGNNKNNAESSPYGALGGSRRRGARRKVLHGEILHNLCALFHKSATWAICSMLRTNFYLLFTSPSSPDCEDGLGLGRAVLVCEALGLRRQSSVWAMAMDAVTRGVKLLRTRAANRDWSCSKLTFLMKQISPRTYKKVSPGRISQLWSISIFSKL